MALSRVVVVMVMMVVMVKGDGPALPDIWQVVKDSYDSRVTVSFPDIDPGVSMMVGELYDINGEQGLVEVTDHSTTMSTYYFKNQQAYVVQGDECSVGTVVEHAGYRIWGWVFDDTESTAGQDNFVYGPTALLRIVRDKGIIALYRERQEVRGIIADHWSIEYLSATSNATLHYYFAVEEWIMPYGHKLAGVDLRAPLRVTVETLQDNPWNHTEQAFIQRVQYDYTEFKPYLSDARKYRLRVPTGLDCKNRVTLDPGMSVPPEAPARFQVFLENIVRPKEGSIEPAIIFRAWMYYDSWVKLMRLDINPDNDATLPNKMYKSIHDYNTGIEYRIDEDGKCTMSTLAPGQLGNSIGSSVIGGIIMADPDILFHLDDKYVFNGYGETRGIKTTRWTSTRDDIMNPETGKNYQKVVVDYEFTSPDTTLEGEVSGASMPARIDTTVYQDDDTSYVLYRHTTNLLHMKTSFEIYGFNPFHVGECMDIPPQRTWIKLTFKGDWYHGASQHPGEFQNMIVKKIAMGTGSSYVRFPEVQLDHDTEMVFATLLLLEPAPYTLEFYQIDDRRPTDNDAKIPLGVLDDNMCAADCLAYPKFDCKSFYLCEKLGNNKNCYVSNFENSDGKPITSEKPCHHYTRALNITQNVQLPNIDVEVWIGAQIVEGKFVISMDYVDQDGQTQRTDYTAMFMSEEIIGDDPILVDLVRADFHVVNRHAKLATTDVDFSLTQLSYVACLAACDGQVSFICESFSYCYNDQSCSLSSVAVASPMDSSDYDAKTDCVIITRSHTDSYSRLEGTVYLGTPKETKGALDPNRCAYLCDTADTFTCRSFDFCYSDLSCNMYDQHNTDTPDNLNTSAAECSHYTRNALVDFEIHENQVLDGNRDRYIIDIAVYECAQVCEDEPDYQCDGFDFCIDESSTTCFLTSAHYSDNGNHISNSPSCDHYSREYYDGQDRNHYAHTKNTKYIYGPGDMAALACSMLVISIALTFAGIYFYNQHKK